MKLLLVTLATCLALHSTSSQANPVSQAGSLNQADPINNGTMDIGMALQDLENLLEIKTNLTRVQQAEIEALQGLQHHLRSISLELEEQQNEVSNPGCDVGQMYDENCYLLVSTPATWQDAQLDCDNRNGSLASVDNAGTNKFIAKLAGGGHSRTWIDGSDAETDGEWKWTNGGISKYSNWDYGEPNNEKGNEHCRVINYLETGKWNDCPCDGLYPYVCQGQKLSKGCESGWKQHGDKCYKVFPEVIENYFGASEKCRSAQAQVASVETEDENTFIKELMKQEQLPSGRDLWLSGRRQSEDSPYIWATGEEMVFNDWLGGRPSRGSDWCMQIYTNGDPTTWQWDTQPCDKDDYYTKDNGVLCEKTAN